MSKRKKYSLSLKGRRPISDEALLNLIRLHKIWFEMPETKLVYEFRHQGGEIPPYTIERAFPKSPNKPSYKSLILEAERRRLVETDSN